MLSSPPPHAHTSGNYVRGVEVFVTILHIRMYQIIALCTLNLYMIFINNISTELGRKSKGFFLLLFSLVFYIFNIL